MSMPDILPWSMGCDSCACELEDCSASSTGTAGARWPGMAASRTLTRKSAPNKMPALVARWIKVLRADMTILLTPYYASQSREISGAWYRACPAKNWPHGQAGCGKSQTVNREGVLEFQAV